MSPDAVLLDAFDHVSFVVVRCLGLRQAFTNDGHFQVAGFEWLV